MSCKEYYCEKCDEQTSSNDSNQHFYVCKQCNYNTNSKQSYERHCSTRKHNNRGVMVSPRKIRSDICPHCEYTTKNSSSMKYHLIRQHMSKEEQKQHFTYWCEFCNVGYLSKSNYDTHSKSNRHQNNKMKFYQEQYGKGQMNVNELLEMLLQTQQNKELIIYDLENGIEPFRKFQVDNKTQIE